MALKPQSVESKFLSTAPDAEASDGKKAIKESMNWPLALRKRIGDIMEAEGLNFTSTVIALVNDGLRFRREKYQKP